MDNVQLMRIVVFSFESLPACSLGCYGSWAIPTSEFDALASRSRLYEHFCVTGPVRSRDFLEFLEQDSAVRWSPLILQSKEALPPSGRKTVSITLPAGELPNPAQISEWWTESGAPVLWIEVAAPLPNAELRNEVAGRLQNLLSVQSADELAIEAEPSPNAVEAPSVCFRDLPDWQKPQADHFAQVLHYDALLTQWLDRLEGVLEAGDVIVLAGSSGDERRQPVDALSNRYPVWFNSIRAQITHLPLIVHTVGSNQGERIPDFVGVPELFRFLISPHDFPSSAEEWIAKSRLHGGEDVKLIRTRDWFLVECANRSSAAETETSLFHEENDVWLFRKPEDYWDMLDVAGQFPTLIQQYRESGRLEEPDSAS